MHKLARQYSDCIRDMMKVAMPYAELLYRNHKAIKAACPMAAVYLDPDTDKLTCKTGTDDTQAFDRLSNCFFTPECPVKVAFNEKLDVNNQILVYRPYTARPIKDLVKKGSFFSSPVGLGLAGSLISGGVGYGVGRGLGWLYGDTKEEARNRARLLGAYGLLGGMIPGAIYGFQQRANTKDHYGTPDVGWFDTLTSDANQLREASPNYTTNMDRAIKVRAAHDTNNFDKEPDGTFSWQKKQSSYVSVNAFNETVWHDVMQGNTQPRDAILTTSIMNNAQQQSNSDYVTPGQIANSLINAGVGYVTAAVAGKTLGALGVLPNNVQDKLKDMGAWSGMLHGLGNAILH